jgi:hypothetical protein
MVRRQRDLRRLADRYGARLERTRNSQWRFLCPDGSIVIAAWTPSCAREYQLTETRLRRAAEQAARELH